MTKIGRNDRCHCGSGTKYKRCCLVKELAKRSPSPAKGSEWGCIVQEPKQQALVDQLTLAVELRGRCKKIAKLAFRPNSADLYVAFPYLTSAIYRCSMQEAPEVTGSATIHTDRNCTETSNPMKFSYHESGQVHFKAQTGGGVAPLATAHATPISRLTGQHLFTIQLEGLNEFSDAKARDRNKLHFLPVKIADDAVSVKIVAYAGFSEGEVIGKYGVAKGADIPIPPTYILTFVRPTLNWPLYVGMYFLTSFQSFQPLADFGRPNLLALTGFQRDGKFLVLHVLRSPKP